MNQVFITRASSHALTSLFRIFTGLLIFCLFFLPPPAFSASQQELKGVKNEISRQKISLNKQSKQLDTLQNTLKRQELSISALEKQIIQTKSKLKKSNNNLVRFDKKVQDLENKKQEQAKRLKQLIQAYYMIHKSNSAEYLFREDPNEDRIRQYYQHLAKTRASMIHNLDETTQQLYQHEEASRKERDQIKQLLSQQTQRYENLKSTQKKRQLTLRQIKRNISSNKNYLAELQRNESRLKAEIAKATKRNLVPMKGLSRQKSKLSWPLKGNILHKFGTRQTGQIRWKGIVINTSYGQRVKAVYSGTVVFSDYLRGYGLVILLDHGKGDMTLYGFNQTLLKKEGDKVSTGEVIALAGDTGGQPGPSLYFEIRRNSKAEDPLRWLTR